MDGDGKRFGGFFRRHAAEIAHLDQLRFQLIFRGQAGEGIIQGQQRPVGLPADVRMIGAQRFFRAAALFRGAGAGHFDQNLAHQAGSDAVKVGAVLVGGMVPAGHAQKRFVNQRRGLQRDGAALAAQMSRRQFL